MVHSCGTAILLVHLLPTEPSEAPKSLCEQHHKSLDAIESSYFGGQWFHFAYKKYHCPAEPALEGLCMNFLGRGEMMDSEDVTGSHPSLAEYE